MEGDFKTKLTRISFISFFILILFYSFFQSRELIFGVKIKNLNIENNQTFTENPITISGQAKNANFISLNDREITIDKEGNFKEDIALLSGYNLLKIEAKDKFGNQDIINYQLLLN